MVSLHGGHSGEFCEHAKGTLRGILDEAVRSGFRVYGVSEHAPRGEERYLYDSERAKGYTTARLEREFEAYARESRRLQDEFRGKLHVLRGFETEAVPRPGYAAEMRKLAADHGFDYVVGSVHHVADISLDESPAHFRSAVDACGGIEPLLERYYLTVGEMIEAVRPQVVAHLDLPKLYAPAGERLCGPLARRAAESAVEATRTHGCILDLNTASLRKGLPEPYPSPWLVRLAKGKGVRFCLGDDSHAASQVGWGFNRARAYLLSLGVETITALFPRPGGVEHRNISLAAGANRGPSREPAGELRALDRGRDKRPRARSA